MGAEIHFSFQKQNSDGWKSISSNFSGDRSYQLFAWLGLEIRNDGSITAISSLRGLPDDIEVKYDNEFGPDMTWGEHSQSWLTSDEILAATPPDDAGEVLLEFLDEVQHLHIEHGAIRIVFGFEG
ncbi:hypothetical protein ACP7OL_004607 [Salmonella enterica subsp. enterica]